MRCTGFAAGLMAATGFASPALATEPLENEPARTIIVSAKNPGEDADAFPGSLVSIGKDELDARQVQDLSSLSYVAPNVTLDPIGTFKGVANFSIRGLGINSSIPSIDPAVGIFMDGVYLGINAGTVLDLLDVERVDILRGPQGVVFGRNTTGGAVLIRTADPSWEWEGSATLAMEGPVDGGRGAPMAVARAIVSGPVHENIAIRLGALHSDDGGYFRNSFDGQDFGKARTTVLRGGLAAEANDRLSLLFKAEHARSRGDGAVTHNNGLFARDTFELSVNQAGFYRSNTSFAVGRADYQLDIGVVTAILGWRDYELSTRNDIDSSPLTIFESDTGTKQRQWSGEVYYDGDFGALAVTLGGFLFHQRVGYDEDRNLAGFGLPLQFGGGRQNHDILGLYGQLGYDLTDRLTLTAGLRFSREDKRAAITYVRARALCSAIAATCPTTGERVPGENNGFTDKSGWSSLSPRLAVDYAPIADARLYASWTRGHRSGGYNLRITQPAAFEEVAAALGSPAFGQERVDSFEIGAKWSAPNDRARLSAALFQTEIANLQREVNVPSLTSGLAQSVYNTADARIRGGEIEAEFRPVPSVRLGAHLGYIDAGYRRVFFDLTGDGVIDAADRGLALPRAPKWSWGGSANWTTRLAGAASLSANAWLQHRSAYAHTDNNWGFNAPSDNLEASLSVNLGQPAITFTLYGKNLLDQVQFGGDTQIPFAEGPFSNGVNAAFDPNPAAGTFSPMFKGRVLGIEVAMDF